MTDIPKRPDADKPSPPKAAAKRTRADELRAMGFKVPPATGEGFGLPLSGPQPPAKQGLTREALEARGFKMVKPTGKGYFLPIGGPAVPKKKPGE